MNCINLEGPITHQSELVYPKVRPASDPISFDAPAVIAAANQHYEALCPIKVPNLHRLSTSSSESAISDGSIPELLFSEPSGYSLDLEESTSGEVTSSNKPEGSLNFNEMLRENSFESAFGEVNSPNKSEVSLNSDEDASKQLSDLVLNLTKEEKEKIIKEYYKEQLLDMKIKRSLTTALLPIRVAFALTPIGLLISLCTYAASKKIKKLEENYKKNCNDKEITKLKSFLNTTFQVMLGGAIRQVSIQGVFRLMLRRQLLTNAIPHFKKSQNKKVSDEGNTAIYRKYFENKKKSRLIRWITPNQKKTQSNRTPLTMIDSIINSLAATDEKPFHEASFRENLRRFVPFTNTTRWIGEKLRRDKPVEN